MELFLKSRLKCPKKQIVREEENLKVHELKKPIYIYIYIYIYDEGKISCQNLAF